MLEQWPALLAAFREADSEGVKAVKTSVFFDTLERFGIYPDEATTFFIITNFSPGSDFDRAEGHVSYGRFLKIFTDKRLKQHINGLKR